MKNLAKKPRIFYIIDFIGIIVLTTLLYILYYIFKSAGKADFSTYPNIFLDFAIRMNNYSNLILSILTFFLVIITAYYAKVTHELLKQTDDNRRFEIKPNLLIKLSNPDFSAVDRRPDMRLFSNKINVMNFGRGPAVGITLTTSVADDNETKGVSQIKDIPVLFPNDSSCEVGVNIHTSQYNLHDYKEDFLRLHVLYEDVERNLYDLRHVYRLVIPPKFDFQEKPFYYLVMKSEELRFRAFEDRISTLESGLFSSTDKVIFSRQPPWKD